MNLPTLNFNQPVVLGRTGLAVGRLGISSGYKAPTPAIEEAFERGCNCFTWGTIIKGYVPQMGRALRNIAGTGVATAWSWPCSPMPITIFHMNYISIHSDINNCAL